MYWSQFIHLSCGRPTFCGFICHLSDETRISREAACPWCHGVQGRRCEILGYGDRIAIIEACLCRVEVENKDNTHSNGNAARWPYWMQGKRTRCQYRSGALTRLATVICVSNLLFSLTFSWKKSVGLQAEKMKILDPKAQALPVTDTLLGI